MTKPDEAFLERLRATFLVEAAEHVQAIASGLVEWEKARAENRPPDQIEAVFRHAHSLKGAARVTGFLGVEALCQSLESVFAACKRGECSPTPAHFDVLQLAIDLISRLVAHDAPATTNPQDDVRISALQRQIREVLDDTRASESRSFETTRPLMPEKGPPLVDPPDVAPIPSETVRVAADKLDRLLLTSEELLALKQAAAQHARETRELTALLGQWNERWARVEPQLRGWQSRAGAAPPALSEFVGSSFDCIKSLEGNALALARRAEAARHASSRLVDDLRADAKCLVMVPFSTLSDFFPKIVRDLGRDQVKEVDLVMHGAELELDKRILEQMKDPLIHLVRNAVTHGIEEPAARMKQHKPRRAQLTLAVSRVEGSKVEIRVTDDGRGIDLARVREEAVKRRVASADAAKALSDQAALDLVFHSGVSTSAAVTELAGRGLGLAIVREQAEKLGGRGWAETAPGVGTTVRIVLPMILASFRGILVRLGGQVFVIPTAQVRRVARVKRSEVRTVENRETISLSGRALALARLERILELPSSGAAGVAENLPFVVLGSGAESIAFAVDEILHDEEVLAKSLVRPLSRVRNVAGATLLASGSLAAILHPADLLKSARKFTGSVANAPDAAEAPVAATKSILIAEDSITTRMLLQGVLESAGYRVATAVDGFEALTTLRTGDFDLVVSDIEMPRMDGFTLTAQIRADRRLAETPIVLVTALASPADRERGIDAGANAYIVKSDFDQAQLLDVIRRLI